MFELLQLLVSALPGRIGLIAAGLFGLVGSLLGISSGIKGFVVLGVLLSAGSLALVLIGIRLPGAEPKSHSQENAE